MAVYAVAREEQNISREQSSVPDQRTHWWLLHVGRQKEMLLETENVEAAAGLCMLTHSKSHSRFLVASII